MTEAIVRLILDGYPLPWDGIHGLRHWARVLENGRRLAEATGADIEVVELFALLHDCRRRNERTDNGHGRRGARFARELRRRHVLVLSDERFDRLHYACERHTDGLIEADVTVQTCWDSDRLDLGRVGITPRAVHLCTPAARDPAVIRWAEERSRTGYEPPTVATWRRWGGDPAG